MHTLPRQLVCFVILSVTLGCGREAGSPAIDPEPNGQTTLVETTPVTQAHVKGKPNRLADETSPYLLLHAHNPVDWYPWGDEALEKAKAEGKMIFLSIGYSSCYWCHVMERESFTDEEIAAVLNEHFIAIKVDREERPDVDQIYMTAVQIYFQAIGSPQNGGWPLSMFLTPDAEPIMGGTYLPPRDRNGQAGFLTVLNRLQAAWQNDPDVLRQNGKRLSAILSEQSQQQAAPAALPGAARLDAVLDELVRQYDSEYGGFGYSAANSRRPKFPEPSNLLFLLDRAGRQRKEEDGAGGTGEAESMLAATLQKMADGGIRDHLGGGFHRYSTDRFWQIPHFEKMLYDNGQLASVYSEAYLLTGRDDFRRVVDDVLRFVLLELTALEGGFYSALDAETDAEEGRYYAWEADEFETLLEDREFKLFADVYGIGERGVFEGRHLPLLAQSLATAAADRGLSEDALHDQLAPIRKKLFDARQTRERPLTDTKVLCAWNGLMIRGFADAGRALEVPQYVEVAETAARFVLERLRTPQGRLLRTFGNGQAKLNAYLDDYAFLVDGLIALHRATGKEEWLQEAARLTETQIELFWDESNGGFFFTSSDHETLIARMKDPADSALPSGNAVSAGNLVYLAQALPRPEYLDLAEKTIGAFGSLFERVPAAMPRMAVSLAALLDARKL